MGPSMFLAPAEITNYPRRSTSLFVSAQNAGKESASIVATGRHWLVGLSGIWIHPLMNANFFSSVFP